MNRGWVWVDKGMKGERGQGGRGKGEGQRVKGKE